MARRLFNKVVIVGVGLIGGSLGKAIKKRGLAREVVGLVRRRQTIRTGVKQKAIDKGFLQPREALKNADLVILATPVETIVDFIPEMVQHLKKGCMVTDVGSCKERIVAAMERKLPKGIAFVGSHPLAGSEKKGVDFSEADIFENTLCILTPTRSTNKGAVSLLKRFWNTLGAKVEIWEAGAHDKILASISHLPHVLAFSLIDTIPAAYLQFSPRSLKDATRVAASDAHLWKGIFLMNDQNVLKAIDGFQVHLNDIKRMIARKDDSGLLRKLKKAKAKRDPLQR